MSVLSSAIFVYCNDGGGGKDASQRGCRGQEVFFLFPWLLLSTESKSLPRCLLLFLARSLGSVRLKHPAAACQTSPGLVLSHWATGQVLGLLVPQGPPGVAFDVSGRQSGCCSVCGDQ